MSNNVKYYGDRVTTPDASYAYNQNALLPGENPPYDIFLSNNNINENEPIGTIIGEFESPDPDIGDFHIYTLVSGGDDNDNFTISNNELKAGIVFDYEAQATHSIMVKSTDTGGNSYQKAFEIHIGDIEYYYYEVGYSDPGYIRTEEV